MAIVNETQETLTYDPGTGRPITIAKSSVEPSFLERLKAQASAPQGDKPYRSLVDVINNNRQPTWADSSVEVTSPTTPLRAPAVMEEEVAAPVVSPETAAVSPLAPVGGVPTSPLGLTGGSSRGYQLSEKAIRDAQDLGIRKAEAESAYYKEKEKLDAEKLRLAQEKKAKFEADAEAADRVRRETEERERAFKFQDYWEKKGTLGKIGAAIAMGLGTYGAALSKRGGPNYAKEIFDNAIKEDMEFQKAQFGKLQADGRAAENAYGRIVQKYKDTQLADQEFYIQSLDKLQNQLKVRMAEYGTDEARVNGTKLLADLQIKKEQAEAARNDRLLEQSYKYGGGVASAPEQKLKKMSTGDKARFDNVVAGLSALKDMKGALIAGSNTFSLIGDNPYTEARTRFSEAVGRLQSGGAISKDEEARFMRMAPSKFDSKEVQQLKLQKMEELLDGRLKTLGFSQAEVPELATRPNTGPSPEERRELEKFIIENSRNPAEAMRVEKARKLLGL